MAIDNSQSTTLRAQIDALAVQAGQLRDAFQKKKPRDLPANSLQDITKLADALAGLREKIEVFEAERSNSMALAKIGGVVNSSLELDAVLRIVMDNIVHLTHAERGFLMLRNEKGEMVTEVARNWEQSPSSLAKPPPAGRSSSE